MSAAPGGTPGSGKVSLLFRLTLRFLQLVFALAVAGLYGIDLDNARKMGKYADRNWVCRTIFLESTSNTDSLGLRRGRRRPICHHMSHLHDPVDKELDFFHMGCGSFVSSGSCVEATTWY